jgi:hypothetical protein
MLINDLFLIQYVILIKIKNLIFFIEIKIMKSKYQFETHVTRIEKEDKQIEIILTGSHPTKKLVIKNPKIPIVSK